MSAFTRSKVTAMAAAMSAMEEEAEEANNKMTKSNRLSAASASTSLGSPTASNRPQQCRACGRSAIARALSNTPREVPLDANGVPLNLRFTTAEQMVPLCDACKKFYCRYRPKIHEESCSCGGAPNDDKCRVCRFQRCEAALLEKKALASGSKTAPSESGAAPLVTDKVDFSKLPCAVCGYSSSGFHFGVVSCEGCKGFFRRSMNKSFKIQYTCKGVKEGQKSTKSKLCSASTNCRKCRLQRCIDAGMSLNEIAIGRHTIRRRAEIDAAIRKHLSEGSFLQTKMCRRKRNKEDDGREDDDESVDVSEMDRADEVLSQDDQPQISDLDIPSFSNMPNLPSNQSMIMNNFDPTFWQRPSSSIAQPQPITPQGPVTPIQPLSQSAVSPLSLISDFSEISSLDRGIQESSDFYLEKVVDAAARLATISTVRVYLNRSMTKEIMMATRVKAFDTYVKCISEFVTLLPGISQISLTDRIPLFTQAFFPVSVAQLSLHFDVERQIPNHFSLDREGDAWAMCREEGQVWHDEVEKYLIDAGNQLVTAIGNLKEFSLCCALLFLNPDAVGLTNPHVVRVLRRRFELALMHYYANDSGPRTEQRLGQFYLLLSHFRKATSYFHDIFNEVTTKRPEKEFQWTPLFKQFHAHITAMPVKRDKSASSSSYNVGSNINSPNQ